MIVGVGCDVVGLDRFAAALRRTPTLRARLFAPGEAALDDVALAGCFAAKEALVKALGAPPGLAWHDVEVRGTTLLLRGTVAERVGDRRATLRLSHLPGAVLALVTLESCA
ncbi:holo-ACP synthase [Nocardioides marmoraquaticus]